MEVMVRSMISSNGNTVPNQFIIHTKTATYFQSYRTIIIKRNDRNGKIYLDKNSWNYSVTTGKYRNQFLNENIAETRKRIESGEYKLKDLN